MTDASKPQDHAAASPPADGYGEGAIQILEGLEAARRGGAAVLAIMTFGFDGERIERYGTAREHGDIVGNL